MQLNNLELAKEKSMQRNQVFEAADVRIPHGWIKDDPKLSRAAMQLDGDNPLHVACARRNLDFVKAVLSLRPEFAAELSRDGFSPLHIASANGDLDTVKELLKVGSHLCLVKGKDGRIPLHYSVLKGREEVTKELLSACSDSIPEVTARGETCFHLAVTNNRSEAFKVLTEFAVLHGREAVLNATNDRGNTILHLAAGEKQYEILSFLLDETSICKGKLEDINSLNKAGQTPLDMLLTHGGDSGLEEMLRAAGAKTFEEMQPASPPQDSTVTILSPSLNRSEFEQEPIREQPHQWNYRRLQKYFRHSSISEPPSSVRNTLLVVAVLITTASYQAVLSPPGGVWQEDWHADNSTAKQPPSHTAGKAVMATNLPVSYGMFLLFNSMGFFMSQHLMYFLTDGLPLQFELRVALFALLCTYDTCMVAVTPSNWLSTFFAVMSIVLPVLVAVLTKLIRCMRKM